MRGCRAQTTCRAAGEHPRRRWREPRARRDLGVPRHARRDPPTAVANTRLCCRREKRFARKLLSNQTIDACPKQQSNRGGNSSNPKHCLGVGSIEEDSSACVNTCAVSCWIHCGCKQPCRFLLVSEPPGTESHRVGQFILAFSIARSARALAFTVLSRPSSSSAACAAAWACWWP